jgi:hypothetical protein
MEVNPLKSNDATYGIPKMYFDILENLQDIYDSKVNSMKHSINYGYKN